MPEPTLVPGSQKPRRRSIIKQAAKSTVKACVHVLQPRILSRGPRAELSPTSYLDGIRGFAAFLVYWQHHQLWARIADSEAASLLFASAWGFEGDYHFTRFPFVRTFFSGGHFAVSVFYVLSGLVLSTKPMSYIHAGDSVKLLDNLSSAYFRRFLRLYMPLWGVTFVYFTSWHLFDIWTPWPERKPTYELEFRWWFAETAIFSDTFNFLGATTYWYHYNLHLWSIPLEWRGSIIIFTSSGMFIYFAWITPDPGMFFSMFTGGMILCDLQLLAAERNLPTWLAGFKPYKKTIFYGMFIASVYLSGVPSCDPKLEVLSASPGWHYLSWLTPAAVTDTKWFFLMIAAIMFVASVPQIGWLKAFFETRFIQYLGHISFSFYLVHGPILWSLGDRIYLATGWPRPKSAAALPQWVDLYPLSMAGPIGLEIAFLLPHLVILPLTLWVAEIVTKVFDRPSVRFTHWLFRRTLQTT